MYLCKEIAKGERVVHLGEEVSSPDGGGADDKNVEKFLHCHLACLAPRPFLLLRVLVQDTHHLIKNKIKTTRANAQVTHNQEQNYKSRVSYVS